MAKFNVTSFNPQAFGAYINTIPQVSKNELIKSRALSVNSEIKRVLSHKQVRLMLFCLCTDF